MEYTMFDVDGFYGVLKKSIEYGSVIMAFAIIYRFFTTQKSRNAHHRYIRAMMYKIYRISWFKLTRSASFYILDILNKVYGTPSYPDKVLTKYYFNQRSWKASFTFALSYIVLGVLALPFFLTGKHNDPSLMIKFIVLTAGLGIGFHLLRKMRSKKNTSVFDKYRQSFISLIVIFGLSVIYNIGVIGGDVFALLVLACLPMFFVWRHGVDGLTSYLLSVILYTCLIVNILTAIGLVEYEVDKYHKEHISPIENDKKIENKDSATELDVDSSQTKKKDINYRALSVNGIALLALSLFVFVYDKKHLSYKKFYKRLALSTLVLTPAVLMYTANIEAVYLYYICLFYFLYAWFFVWGLVSANSVADLISSNVSRWLFLKIQKYHQWKQVVSAGIMDMFVGAFLVLLASLLIAGMLSSLVVVFGNESPVSIYQAMLLTSEAFKATDSTLPVPISEFNLFHIFDSIVNSYYLVPRYFGVDVVYSYYVVKTEYASTLDGLGYGLWYLYCTTLIPTIMHGCFIVLLLFSKIATHFIQKPALYSHKLLLEDATGDGALGKAFSGSTRAIIFIGMVFTAISLVAFSLINFYGSN